MMDTENRSVASNAPSAQEDAMYRVLLDQSSAMITVIDAETYRVVYANAAAREVTKGFLGGYVGSVCYQSITHRDAPCPDCLLETIGDAKERVREVSYGGRVYRMVYKQLEWNGRRALMEYSEDITEQKQVLLMAEENARQHEWIINNLLTGIIVYKIENHTYKVLQVNPAVCAMMGITPKLAIGTSGKAVIDLVHPEDRSLVVQAAMRMAVPGAEVHYEFRSRTMEHSTYIWLAADGKSAVQPDGSIYVYVSYKDITDSRERELEFQQKVDFLANLNDETLISKGLHNLTRNFVLSVEGKKIGSIIGEMGQLYDALLPELVATALDADKQDELRRTLDRQSLLAAFAQGTRDFSIDYRRRLNGETQIWATIRGSLYEEPVTHDVIAFLYSYDSTDQIQEAQILRKLSTLEYGLLGLIDVRTRSYKTMYLKGVSPETYKDLCGSYDSLIALRCSLPSLLDDPQELLRQVSLETILEQLKTRSIYDVEYSATGQNGAFQRMRFHYSFLDDNRDTVIFFSSDITEYYLKEQEQLRKIAVSLQEAQEANRAKTQFFSRMSHDMRTPMNGILGMAALSENENDPAILKENLLKIRESGKYLLSLINDTLDLQRIESGKMKLEPQIISTVEVVGNILDIVRTAADAKGVALRFDPGNADLSWYVKADPVRIKQVFINLLSNAVKFTPRGGTVLLSSRLVRREGMISHDVFTVRDTGIGMSRDFLQNRIFQPFSQENNQVTANYAGSGLGLSIAKSLIELMGGTIEVESELGVGTTFTIHLDLERVKPEDAQHLLQSQKQQTENQSVRLKGKRILLAEDHPLNAEIAEKLLARVGCSVCWMQNGRTALECFAASDPFEFDAVLMDIRMPVMDGLESARLIRALDRPDAGSVPIIAMTANAYDEDVKKSLAVGMDAHLGKPIEPAVMYSTLAALIDKNR